MQTIISAGHGHPRFSEQRPRRGDDIDDDEGDEDQVEAGDSDNDDDNRGQHEDRPQREERSQREDRHQRDDRPQREDRPQRAERAERNERPRPARERTPRSEAGQVQDSGDRNMSDRGNGGGETIPFDVLPPAIGLDVASDVRGKDEAPEEKAPVRRRTRAPRRPDSDSDVAPAA